jgi:hypothetical protein
MRFGCYVFLLCALAYGGLYVVYRGGTAASACRDIGAAIGDLGSAGLGRSVDRFGQSIEDMCSGR